MLASLYKARADTLPGESKQWKKIWYVNCDFWDRRTNLENDIASEKQPQNQNALIKINNLGVILLRKEFYTQ